MKTKRFALTCLMTVCLAAPVALAGEARLVKLDNGTVNDTHTGLVWQLGKSPQMFNTPGKAE